VDAVDRADAVVGEPWQPPAPALGPSSDPDALTWRWDFGDGLRAEGPRPEVTFEAPGHRTAFVTVTDAAGRSASDAFALSVAWPVDAAAPPASSGALAASPTALFAALTDHDQIAIIPFQSTRPSLFDPGCAAPIHLALDAAGARLAVTCAGRDLAPPSVRAFALDGDTPSREPVWTDILPDAHRPFGAALWSAPGGEVGLAFTTLDRATGAAFVGIAPDGQPPVLTPAGRDVRAVQARGAGVWAVDWRALDGGDAVVWGVADARASEPRITTLFDDPGPDSDTNSRGRPTFLGALALSPNGRMLAVGGARANTGRGVLRDGLPLTDETTVRGTLRRVDLTTGAQDASARVDNRDRYSALAFSERGDWLYAAVAGSGTVDVIDPWRWERVGAAFDGGHGLEGLVVADGALWGFATLDRALLRWDLTDPAAPSGPTVTSLLPPEGEVLPPDVLAGAKLFAAAADPRMSLDGYVACASCHVGGEPDGHTWDFTQRGEGVRNTPDLRGLGLRPGPIHWSGNFDEIQDFEADIRLHQGGRGYLDDPTWQGPAGPSLGEPKAGLAAELDALDAYLQWLRAPPVPWVDADTDDGADAFARYACDACHPGGGTDSAWLAPGEPLLHDVGTLTSASGQRLGGPLLGVDTPDLRGAWATGPWLHDGSAPTLGDAVQAHAPVAPEDLDALVRYLRSL
jgi:hypothetical protein